MVTPVSKILTYFCGWMIVALATVQTASSQSASSPTGRSESGRSESGRRSGAAIEQEARAQWQPVRDLSTRRPAAGNPAANPTVTGSAKTLRPATQAPALRQVDFQSGPMANGPVSVMQTSPGQAIPLDGQIVQGQMVQGQMVQGQIMHGPIIHDDGYDMSYDGGCDGLPGGSCGCGSCGGMGTCDVGCDGIACGGCCGGNPMCGQYNDCDALAPCVTLCFPQDGWLSAEYLLWWQDGMSLPPLASTGRLPSAAGDGTGQTLFGGNDVLTDTFDGFRLDFGFWLDNCHTWAVGADYFQIGNEREGFFANNNGPAILGRPFLNSQMNASEDIELVNAPGIVSGALTIDVDSELIGWGVNVRHMRCAEEGCVPGVCGPAGHYCSRTSYLLGFRQVQLSEGVFIHERLTGTPNTTSTALTDGFAIEDRFRTRNQFNGVEAGWLYNRTRGYWSFDADLRLGVGSTRQRVNIDGSTVITGSTLAGNGQTQVGGLLAQASNIGTYERDEFAVMPQLNLKLGYQLTDQLRATVGYTFLYWSNVVRPGDQIDRLVDVSQMPSLPSQPTPAATFPEFNFRQTDYWAQGVSFGGEYRW